MMIKHAIIPLIALLNTCDSPDTPPAEEARPAQHIYIGESYDTPFDARSGDTITVIMDPNGDPVTRCLDMGGEPIYNPHTLIYSCDDVDF